VKPRAPSQGQRLQRSLTGCALFCMLASAVAEPLAPFTTDGCSLFPDRSVMGKSDWCDCCLAHDLAYWRGGTDRERLKADQALRTCVEHATQDPVLARTMYLGVRAGGGPYGTTPFRWGYGWPYGRGYQTLNPAEASSAKLLEDAYRAKNPALQCKTNDPPVTKASAPH